MNGNPRAIEVGIGMFLQNGDGCFFFILWLPSNFLRRRIRLLLDSIFLESRTRFRFSRLLRLLLLFLERFLLRLGFLPLDGLLNRNGSDKRRGPQGTPRQRPLNGRRGSRGRRARSPFGVPSGRPRGVRPRVATRIRR